MSKVLTQPNEEFGHKIDKCITDAIIKLGGGATIGLMSSILFLGRRRWPIIAGAGVGVGIAYANCEFSLNTTIRQLSSESH